VSELPTSTPGAGLERRSHYQLTAVERATRRRNRRWLVAILLPSLVVGTAALVVVLAVSSSRSGVQPLSVPTGYRAVTDGYFAYAIPKGWTQNDAYTDDVGDLDHQGTSGWAGRTRGR